MTTNKVRQLQFNNNHIFLTKIERIFMLITSALFLLTNALAEQNFCPSGMISLFHGALCTNDYTCQGLATGFFCLRGRCCSHIVPPPFGYGTSCSNDDQCRLTNGRCSGNVCYCKPGFNYNGVDCIPRILYDAIGQSGCGPGFISINSNCYGYVGFGGFCDYSKQCNFVGGICQANHCKCPSGQIFDGVRCINDPNGFVQYSQQLPLYERDQYLLPPLIQQQQQPQPQQNQIGIVPLPQCSNNEVFVFQNCYQKRLSGQACVYSEQCQSLDALQRLECIKGVCTPVQQPLMPSSMIQLPLPPSPQPASIGFNQKPPLTNFMFSDSSIYNSINFEYDCDDARLLNPNNQRLINKNCVVHDAIHSTPCGTGQVRINGVCYPLVSAGDTCAFDLQCRSSFSNRGMFCDNFVCRFADVRQWNPYPYDNEFPTCRNPSAEVELSSVIPKDCLYQRCSPGFHCEYNNRYKGGQYICCGAHTTNPIYGRIKMYPGYTNLPLECKALNSCTFVDFPFCVYSESYGHRVCCSKSQCL